MSKFSQVALEEFQRQPRTTQRGRERVLSDLEVKDILLDPRVMREIAEDWGISRALVAKIKDRTASYFFDREAAFGQAFKNDTPDTLNRYDVVATPNMSLVTLPVVVAPVGHPTALDEEAVARIKADLRTLREIAEDLDVSVTTVWRVKNGQYQGRAKHSMGRNERVGTVAGKPVYEDDLRRKNRRA